MMNGKVNIKKKVESWGHQEYNNDFIKDNIEQRVKEGKDIFFRTDMKYVPFPISETMPKYIVENREKFSSVDDLNAYRNNQNTAPNSLEQSKLLMRQQKEEQNKVDTERAFNLINPSASLWL